MDKTTHTPLPAILEVTETGIDSADIELMEPDGASYLAVIENDFGPDYDEVDFARMVALRYNSHDRLVEALQDSLKQMDDDHGFISRHALGAGRGKRLAAKTTELRALLAELEGGA